jgi:hypothetical protein
MTATPLNPNGAILNTASLNPTPYSPYPQTIPGMQSWAGFYGGNVSAPSFLPHLRNYPVTYPTGQVGGVAGGFGYPTR